MRRWLRRRGSRKVKYSIRRAYWLRTCGAFRKCMRACILRGRIPIPSSPRRRGSRSVSSCAGMAYWLRACGAFRKCMRVYILCSITLITSSPRRRGSRKVYYSIRRVYWVPAFAGMTTKSKRVVEKPSVGTGVGHFLKSPLRGKDVK
jgi:hypothetical protein